MLKIVLNKNWKMRKTGEDKWNKVNISESILGDPISNNQIRNFYFNVNELKKINIIDYTYEYRNFFDVNEEIFYCDKVILNLEKVSTLTDIYFNDKLLLTSNNINVPYKIDITNSLKIVNNEIKVIFHSPSDFLEIQPNSKFKMDDFLYFPYIEILGYVNLLSSNK
ncbi:hypothetical protein [Clostridium sp. D53t1_180928_C8]|uniref:glycosyl hydrolase 2 galactose-binding domain-containing protein n=1 Tax=Clostridium sp. D53t1_180928_C8 TaxID=2787101 RepID=UPI0018ABE7F1|nr:hypothetical protein [Clostridium sp. D53t1_180928_C8]